MSTVRVIRRHIVCVGCGYDLFEQPFSGHCPECGLEIHVTLQRGLEFASPTWLRRLVIGQRLVIGCMIMTPALVVGFLGESIGGGSFVRVSVWTVGAGVSLLLTGYLGVWLLTSRDRREGGLEPLTVPRRVARAALAVAGVWCIAMMILSSIGWRSPLAYLAFQAGVLFSPFGLAGAIGVFSLERHWQLLRPRANDRTARPRKFIAVAMLFIWPLCGLTLAMGNPLLQSCGALAGVCVAIYGLAILCGPSSLSEFSRAARESARP